MLAGGLVILLRPSKRGVVSALSRIQVDPPAIISMEIKRTSTLSLEAEDYATGEARRHHRFYLEHGDLVLQVHNAIFKIHRVFLAQHSSVLDDLFHVPQSQGSLDGTDEQPLVLFGDTVRGWEILLTSIYRVNFLKGVEYSATEMMAVLPIAHKYCMESIEQEIIDKLKAASSTADYVDLMVASQIVGSEELHSQAFKGLVSSDPRPNLEQTKRIGIEVYYELMQAVAVPLPDNAWLHCVAHNKSWGCSVCQRYQS